MIFDIQTSNKKVAEAYFLAQDILISQQFLSRLYDCTKFTYTKDSRLLVVSNFENTRDRILLGGIQRISVKDYTYRSKSVVATTYKNDPAIYINLFNVSRFTTEIYVANAAHEFGHNPLGYSHGSNFPPGSWRGRIMGDREDKNFSVPHTLETIALEIYRKRLNDINS